MVNPSARKNSSGERSASASGSQNASTSNQSTGFSTLHYKFACASVRALKKNKNAAPFLVPVDWINLGIPHYPTVIERPMDFATIERKLFATLPGQVQAPDDDSAEATRYYSVDEWIADVHVVFQNSYIFNGPEHPISIMASALQLVFERQLKKLPSGDEALSFIAGSTPSQLSTSKQDGVGSGGPKSAGLFDEPSSREQSQVPTPFSRTSLELPPQASGSGTNNSAPSSEELKVQQLSFCKKLLDHLHKPEFQHFAWFFYNPVREEDVPGYFNVIDKPMSLAVMREKLDSGGYPDADAFRADFDQIIWNCNKFNPPGSAAQVSGKQLKDVFLKKWKMLPGGSKKAGAISLKTTTKSTATSSVKVTPAGGQDNLSLPPTRRGSSDTQIHESPSEMNHPNGLSLPVPPSLTPTPQLTTKSTPPTQPSPSNLLPSHLPNPTLTSIPTSSSIYKRKSDVFREDDLLLTVATVEEGQAQVDEDAFDHRDHTRLARVIRRLTGAELARAVAMIKDGLHSGVTRIANETGDAEYEIASLPEPLVRALHEAFVPRRVRRRAAKRPKTGDTGAV
ncbi:hypothetical protein FRB97_004347 [Tulasnella sp. 331]|nr:hypothetical protein FRB97_004347 [Tulasnella sp. 331]KAG8882502.1 hypothetical protein FRB98_003631 [Tulasnella sp. 332]